LRIALDTFGGDSAPQATVEGARLAIAQARQRKLDGFEIVLVGNRKALKPILEDKLPEGLEVLDIPAGAAREGINPHSIANDPGSPIRTALRLHRDGRCDAVVSAGSTAAQVVASLLELEKCSGITRPAVGVLLPTETGHCFLLDVGASLVASPHHLVQFAAMGHVYVRELLGITEPRIGVLNVGRESLVGDRSTVGAYRLLSDSGFNFTGFIEGRDLLTGAADVVVANGFVGNILLKFLEGLPVLLKQHMPLDDAPEVREAIENRFDYQAFGGEPLLGVKGVSIICHGASTPKAIAAAIMQANRMVQLKLHEKLEAFLVDKFASYFSRVKYLRSFRRAYRHQLLDITQEKAIN